MSEIEEVLKEWDELSNEYKNLEVSVKSHQFWSEWNLFCDCFFQNVNKSYLELLDGLEEMQSKCMKDISHQRYRILQITKNLK